MTTPVQLAWSQRADNVVSPTVIPVKRSANRDRRAATVCFEKKICRQALGSPVPDLRFAPSGTTTWFELSAVLASAGATGVVFLISVYQVIGNFIALIVDTNGVQAFGNVPVRIPPRTGHGGIC